MTRNILVKVKKKKTQRTNIKSSKNKATHNTQGDTHKVKSCSFYKNPAGQKGVAGYTSVMKEKQKNYNQYYSVQQGSHPDSKEKSNIQATVKRIHHHQTSFTKNAERTSIDRKQKIKKRPRKQTQNNK